MSFILEALKKSEEERRQGTGPDPNALYATETSRKSGRHIWPILFFSALLINALFLLWWLCPWRPATDPSPPGKILAGRSVPTPEKQAPASVVAQDLLPASPPARTFRQAPPGWNDLPASTMPSRSSPGRTAVSDNPARIPYLQELPAEMRRQIPELAITLHYYTADPASRLARVNDTILREGQSVNNQLTLERITADSIVFRLGEIRFRAGEF